MSLFALFCIVEISGPAISDAATWDDQLSEGKPLSDREEAVLQALEILTGDEPKWFKAGDLREQV